MRTQKSTGGSSRMVARTSGRSTAAAGLEWFRWLFERHGWVLVLLALAAASPTPAAAQRSAAIVAGLGAGGTYYCIVSRCGTGSLFGAVVGMEATRNLVLEAGLRRHVCTDCGEFLIGDLVLLLQSAGSFASPFIAAGLSYSSDPDFMGKQIGLVAGAGSSFVLRRQWRLRIEVRGRQVGRGDAMGDLSISVLRRFGGRT